MRNLFDANPDLRTESEWRQLLAELVEALSRYTGVEFEPTSWYTGDDTPGHAGSSNCVNIRGVINQALSLDACGVVCVSVNFGEAVWVSCDLLLFAASRRLDHFGLISLLFRENGWVSKGPVVDDTGEWESHTTDARWTPA